MLLGKKPRTTPPAARTQTSCIFSLFSVSFGKHTVSMAQKGDRKEAFPGEAAAHGVRLLIQLPLE